MPPLEITDTVRNRQCAYIYLIDPPEIYNLRVFVLALCSCFGGTLFGMDIGIIGGVITQDAFQKAFGFSQLSTAQAEKADANLSADIVSVMQAGAFFGALFAYPVADKSVLLLRNYTLPQ